MAFTPDSLSLVGKVAIVTGSGRENGIGAAIAYALARNGASVTITHVSDSSASRAQQVLKHIESIGGKAIVVQADLETVEGAAKLVNDTLVGFHTDKIDILINNAGSGAGQGSTAMETSSEDTEKAFKSNVYSGIFVTQAASKHIPRGGRIVNIGTVVTHMQNLPGVSVYGASKAAQEYLTSAWAYELGRSQGITVNTIAPGGTKTDAGTWFPDGDMRRTVGMNLLTQAQLEQRAAEPEEIADAVLLVVSLFARWITGQYIAVSGGITH